ncbi:hypothetical protein BpHYR1_046208 [Brachionus plicatilis]|uniref:Uncharacterized protein n=1 Tax=Brachionus plicatilis TaxID=10195 RepID=A0A3M7SN18_BRAPC|nr:hypothetical protein BpHYR1_046208 [Brachionus plicatilis]
MVSPRFAPKSKRTCLLFSNGFYKLQVVSNNLFFLNKNTLDFLAKISHGLIDKTLLICLYAESAQSHLQNGLIDILEKNGFQHIKPRASDKELITPNIYIVKKWSKPSDTGNYQNKLYFLTKNNEIGKMSNMSNKKLIFISTIHVYAPNQIFQVLKWYLFGLGLDLRLICTDFLRKDRFEIFFSVLRQYDLRYRLKFKKINSKMNVPQIICESCIHPRSQRSQPKYSLPNPLILPIIDQPPSFPELTAFSNTLPFTGRSFTCNRPYELLKKNASDVGEIIEKISWVVRFAGLSLKSTNKTLTFKIPTEFTRFFTRGNPIPVPSIESITFFSTFSKNDQIQLILRFFDLINNRLSLIFFNDAMFFWFEIIPI